MPYRSAILAAIDDIKDHQTGSPISSIKHHIQNHNSHIDASDDDKTWNETLFQHTLKSLVEHGDLVHYGSNYKFSDAYLKKRAEQLQARAAARMEHLSALRTHPHSTTAIAGGTGGITASQE